MLTLSAREPWMPHRPAHIDTVVTVRGRCVAQLTPFRTPPAEATLCQQACCKRASVGPGARCRSTGSQRLIHVGTAAFSSCIVR